MQNIKKKLFYDCVYSWQALLPVTCVVWEHCFTDECSGKCVAQEFAIAWLEVREFMLICSVTIG